MPNDFPPLHLFGSLPEFDSIDPENLQALHDSWKNFVSMNLAGMSFPASQPPLTSTAASTASTSPPSLVSLSEDMLAAHAQYLGQDPTSPAFTSDRDDDKPVTYSTALQTQEPEADAIHPDIDRTDVVNLSRLIALFQSGWTLSRGHGPRNNDFCLWCRGPMTEHTEILIHDCGPNTSAKCNNAWPASCFLQSVVNFEIDKAGTRVLRCPMCRAEIFNAHRLKRDPRMQDFQHPTYEVVPAHIRVLLFGARLALQYAKEHGSRPLFFMERAEVAKLAMLGRNSVVFRQVDALKHPERGEDHFVTLWLVIDWGNNEYRMTPYLSTPNIVPEMLRERISPLQGIRFMTAQEVEHEAAVKGGLAEAVAAFMPDLHDESIKEMVHGGKQELLMIIEQWVSSARDEEARERCKAMFVQLTKAFGICMPQDETKSAQIRENQVADQDGDVEMTQEEYEDSIQHTHMETDDDEDEDNDSWAE